MKDAFTSRKYIIIAFVVLAALLLIIRLFVIQVVKDTYRLSADNNVLRYVTQYPARGLIYDRNNKLMVFNQAAYDLMVVPAQVTSIDTAEFCELLEITKSSFNDRMNSAISYSRRAPSVFLKQISAESYARFQEKLFLYPGFYVQPRTLRKYSKPIAGHILGYVSEVDESVVKNDPYYKAGDYIGKLGIEEAYEKNLRGKRGVTIYLVDVYSRIKGSYADGRMDTVAVQGEDIISTVDMDLQEYGELLMKNKSGSIVALEPKTGEVLTLVSSPNYDPGLLVGRIRSENFMKLSADTSLPLFNRAIQAKYPPGSTFKPINGLIGLQEKVIEPSTLFGCSNGYLFIGCHSHSSPLDLIHGISNSCNAYFCQVYRRILENPAYPNVEAAYVKWKEYLDQFGFGQRLGIEFTNELTGFVPSPSYYDRFYGKNGWKALTIISMAIGQGEVETTPLQMANMTAAIANRGYYYTPHIVKSIGAEGKPDGKYLLKHTIEIDSANFESIVLGMEEAVNGGAGATARSAAIRNIIVCGKTGTAENPHGKDHSVFIAFAPKDDPKIAIAVYVENAGFGASYAAPIASLMIEKYLTGEVTNKYSEQRMLELNLIAGE
ncbi:MAG: penicillin-binding protein 2 [Bacteroidales bacterium]|jgi:penicillin-binding protein 2|nr:penicillin-binding protein 2 [Bacteroidales bacterium]MBP7038508.1 penicillin-binding protein 2 [Bacteroidales bacterium]MDI9553796.1 penicillin-binding protein 2 [Bacteroidota bacterium]NLK55649.1 penicillin-binding protein 2 [Bacteroidales bacterium]HPB12419.1 penicillin-binding protein 2 [Bacteroidales bacterium]